MLLVDFTFEPTKASSLTRLSGSIVRSCFSLMSEEKVEKCEISVTFQKEHRKRSEQMEQLQYAYILAKKDLDDNYNVAQGVFCNEETKQAVEKKFTEIDQVVETSLCREDGLWKSFPTLSLCVYDKRYAAVFLNVIHEFFNIPVDKLFDVLEINRNILTQSYSEQAKTFLKKGDYEGALQIAKRAKKHKGNECFFYSLGEYCQSIEREVYNDN